MEIQHLTSMQLLHLYVASTEMSMTQPTTLMHLFSTSSLLCCLQCPCCWAGGNQELCSSWKSLQRLLCSYVSL